MVNDLRGVWAVALLAGAAALLAAAPARAELASPWKDGYNSRVRLVAGSISGKTYAGVEIQLAPGWKTYWRNPGTSGVPPRFDWAGSENVALCAARETQKPRTRLAYLWAVKVPNIEAPKLELARDAHLHAMAVPRRRYLHVGGVPRRAEVVACVLKLLVPTARYRDRARRRQVVVPPLRLADAIRVDLEAPQARDVDSVPEAILLRVQHGR